MSGWPRSPISWRQAERIVADIMGGRVCTDKKMQVEQDIDVVYNCQNGAHLGKTREVTVSVKLQPGLSRYRNVSFELELADERGNRVPGNWANCRAEEYAVFSPLEPIKVDGRWTSECRLFYWNTATLAAIVNDTERRYRVAPIKAATQAANARDGRTFTQAFNRLVPLEDVLPLARWTRRIDLDALEKAA
jgi:hypothetical protein